MPEDGAEATFAPGQDLSLDVQEMLLEDLFQDAEIKDVFAIHYDIIELGQYASHVVEVKSLDAAMANAKQLTKSGSINPASIKVTSHRVITTPLVEHKLKLDPPPKAPRWKAPKPI
jgi:hypothetical protein